MDSWGCWKYAIKKLGEPRVSAIYLEDKFQEYNLFVIPHGFQTSEELESHD